MIMNCRPSSKPLSRVAMVALAAALVVSSPKARADCPLGDDVCELSAAVILLDADVRVRDATITRLDREVRACRATVSACPEPVEQPFPWGVVAGTAGVALVIGVVLGLLARD